VRDLHQYLFLLVEVVTFDAGRLQQPVRILAAMTLATDRYLRQQHVFAAGR
jgi:hypothetical protein